FLDRGVNKPMSTVAASSPAKETTTYAEKLGFSEVMITDVDAVQERVLAEILGRNGDSEYLVKKCGLAGATDRAAFRAKVPMVSYEDLQPYIQRIADGDRSPLLTGAAHPVSEFLTSSGTSGGERKQLPTFEDEVDRRQLLFGLVMPVISQYIPELDKGTALVFMFVKSETMTPGGLPARTVLTNAVRPVPAPRRGARRRRVCLRAIRFLQMHWEQLVADVEAGALNQRVTDPSVREAVAGVLRADPVLARFVRAECCSNKNDDWAGIIKRIWPNTMYLDAIVTGSMAQYVPALDYYSGGLPVASNVYASSECSFGINLRPMCHPSEVSYTIMPNMAYFEFLPVDGDGDASHEDLLDVRARAGRDPRPQRRLRVPWSYKSNHFKNSTGTSPLAAILCEDTFQSMYAQMLCGLCRRRDVVRIGTVFAPGLLRAVRFLQMNWEQLAGVLNPRVTDQSVHESVADILRPDPDLAQFIRAEWSKGDWAGIITRIWPNAKCVETVVTGSMAQYVPTLNYYSGGLPVISTAYASSECFFGFNLNPLCDPSEVSYTFMPNMAYFEFLPVDGNGDTSHEADLVELARVEVGREYELVVTTYSGLNRYRIGDILRVTGFHNAAPQFSIVGRQNVLLSIEFDKTDEAELQRAVERASSALLRPHGVVVLDYTSRACTESIPGHYVIYWELLLTNKDAAVDGDVLERCCLEIEDALNPVYRQSRVEDGSIGPLEIRVVRPGTFEELMDYAISRGTSIAQYKVPRCVTLPPVVELLDSHVVSCHFSPKLPHWTPGQPQE
ncbi:hypothetical protein EJB05_02138, partial [Eragrostis curvula]